MPGWRAVLPPVDAPARGRTLARMSVLTFDAHQAVKTLCEAGAAEPLAEAFVEIITGNVATKADISESETALGADIAESDVRLQAKIADVQAETKADIAGIQAEVAEVRTEVANVQVELKTGIGLARAGVGDLEGRLYRQLWSMAAGIVGLTVALVKLLG